jgi:hypothetical protein
MKLRPASSLIYIAALLLAFEATTGEAQTIANGPYYATPSWDQTLPVNTRFIVLANMNQQAVLDRETGLVWDRSPGLASFDHTTAVFECANKSVGGRKGWRLPAMAELESLLDETVPFPGPVLTPGHPFMNVTNGGYWSSWTDGSTGRAAVFLDQGGARPVAPNASLRVWCVRGMPTSGSQ